MVNLTTKTDYFYTILTHFPLIIIVLGLIGNTVSFLVFRLHHEFKNMAPMVYLSFLAISDTFSLFGWNMDHYLSYNFNFNIFDYSLLVCKLVSFEQYASLQASALFLCMITIDRYKK